MRKAPRTLPQSGGDSPSANTRVQRFGANGMPDPQGLYDPRNEHDACGMGFVASVRGEKSHTIIVKGLEVLMNLTHRGACGCDPETGDGAGMLIQIPHKFFARECAQARLHSPAPGRVRRRAWYSSRSKSIRAFSAKASSNASCRKKASRFSAGAIRPSRAPRSAASRAARSPTSSRSLSAVRTRMDEDAFERKLYVVRKRTEVEICQSDIEDKDMFYIPSLSCRTIVYKGLLLAPQIANFYRGTVRSRSESALCLVHQRFSTNTFPSWQLAHPYPIHRPQRRDQYAARQRELDARPPVDARLATVRRRHQEAVPDHAPGGSDSAAFDNARGIAGARLAARCRMCMAMLIPEAWAANPHMKPEKRAFYEYHASLMEPWDGPAAIAFTDGRVIGATLDRNGLRPARYVVTNDDMVVHGV